MGTKSLVATEIPSAFDVDYASVQDICGYQLLMAKLYEQAGGMDYPAKTNVAIRQIQSEGRHWLKEVKYLMQSLIDSGDLSGIPALLRAYDLMYRICNAKACFDYLSEIRTKTIDSWARGNRTVGTTDIVLLIGEEIDRDVRRVQPRYVEFYLKTREKWIDQLLARGRFTEIPAAEAYTRLDHLLRSDLCVYLGSKTQNEIKKRWLANSLITNISGVLTSDLIAYLPLSQKSGDYRQILAELSIRPELNRYFRAALLHDLHQLQAVA